MKKNLLCLLPLAGFVMTLHAQKNSILLYGTINAQHKNEPDNSKIRQFGFSPGIGYQFSDKWTAGIAGGYGHEKLQDTNGSETKSSDYKAGGFLRYAHVFNPIFSIYGQSDIYYHGKKEQSVRSNGIAAAIVPTIGINVSNGFALNVSFGGISYEHIKAKGANDATNDLNMNFAHEISIGISKNFARKK